VSSEIFAWLVFACGLGMAWSAETLRGCAIGLAVGLTGAAMLAYDGGSR